MLAVIGKRAWSAS